MKYSNILIFPIVAGVIICGCSDSVAPVDFSVSIPSGNEVSHGQPVKFVFYGNPDYITFYSGEPGCDYEASDRLEAEISSLELGCTIRQQYNDAQYLDRQLIYIYASTDFSGDYSVESINAATWKPLAGTGANSLPVPVASSASAVTVSGSIRLDEYVDVNKPFYLAFLYNAPGRADIPSANGSGKYMTRPRIDIADLVMTKTLADGGIRMLDNALTQFGMRAVYERSYQNSNFKVNDDGMLFQPVKAELDPQTGREPDERVWMVSACIDPRKVEPDQGIAVKSVAERLNAYEYVYDTPGVYTAAFVATNANLWDNKRKVRQLTITVK